MTDYFERKLDDKHRLTIPAEIREELGREVVITRGFGKYLHLYSKKTWDESMEPALSGDLLDERIADLNIQFRYGRTAHQLDAKQGRITLEAHQLRYAGIHRDIIVVRVGRYWRIIPKETHI